MKHTIVLSFALAALAACSTAVAPGRDASALGASAQPGRRADTLSIRLGQTGSVDGGRLELTFDAKVGDSRCPANVVCVWMGDAHVRLATRVAGGAAAKAELHSALEPNQLKIDRYTIAMVALTPYPGTGQDDATPVLALHVARD